MKRIWKCYLAFVPYFCRILMFGIFPVLLAALMPVIRGAGYALLFFITGELVLLFFITMDNLCFGGIATREVGQPEYMKSSGRGRIFMKNAILGSAAVPFALTLVIWAVGILLMCLPLGYPLPEPEELLRGLAVLCIMETALMAGYTVSRFFETAWIYMLTAWLASMLMGGGAALTVRMSALLSVLTGMVFMVVTGIVYWRIMRWRLEGSYYDERF